jgi:hypothetical protein
LQPTSKISTAGKKFNPKQSMFEHKVGEICKLTGWFNDYENHSHIVKLQFIGITMETARNCEMEKNAADLSVLLLPQQSRKTSWTEANVRIICRCLKSSL